MKSETTHVTILDFFLVITTNITINKQKGFISSNPYISSEEALDTLSNLK